MQIFVDMDGVLADFDRHYHDVFGHVPDKLADDVDWDAVRRHDGFFAAIPPMPDFERLWHYLEPLNPIVLTGVPRLVPEAPDNKRSWVVRHIGDQVPVICCRSREKSLHAAPGDLLIDDWEKYKDIWVGMGGKWITHTGAETTIAEMEARGIVAATKRAPRAATLG